MRRLALFAVLTLPLMAGMCAGSACAPGVSIGGVYTSADDAQVSIGECRVDAATGAG